MREKEINLVDFMIEILMHWRGMILMMLLGAMLLGSFSYVSYLPRHQPQDEKTEETDTSTDLEEELTLTDTIKKYLTSSSEDLEAAIRIWFGKDLPDLNAAVKEQLQKELTEEQLTKIDYVLYYEALYNDKKSFQDESVMQQLDIDSIQRCELIFGVTADDLERAYNLEKVYEDFIKSSELISMMSQKSGISVSALGEIFWLSRSSSELLSGTDTFKVSILHDDENICQGLADMVIEYIEDKHQLMTEQRGPHEVSLLSRSMGKISKLSILSKQREMWSTMLSLQNNYVSRKKAFSEGEWYYYNLLTNGKIAGNPYAKPSDSQKQNEDSAQKDDVSPVSDTTPGISLKYVVIGMILALFLYLFIIFIKYVLNKKLRSTDQLAELYHISQLGIISDSKRKQKAFGAIDQAILSLHYGNEHKLSPEESMNLAMAKSKLAIQKNGLKAIGLIGCGLKGPALKYCEKMQDALKAADIKVFILNNILYDAEAMEALMQVDSVILVETAGVTLYTEIAQELELLQRQGIPLLGGIIAE